MGHSFPVDSAAAAAAAAAAAKQLKATKQTMGNVSWEVYSSSFSSCTLKGHQREQTQNPNTQLEEEEEER